MRADSSSRLPNSAVASLLAIEAERHRVICLPMKKKPHYTDEPLGRIRIIKDFLPPPEALVFKGAGNLRIEKGSRQGEEEIPPCKPR